MSTKQEIQEFWIFTLHYKSDRAQSCLYWTLEISNSWWWSIDIPKFCSDIEEI